MLVFDGVRYAYNRTEQGIDNVSCSIMPGKIYGLLGKNGSGKTTSLRIASSLLFPLEGQCTVDDISVQKRSEAVLQKVYYFPEDLYTISLTGNQFLTYYSKYYPHFDFDYCTTLCNELAVQSLLTRSMAKLSLGQRKKIFLSFALSTGACYLLLDEPTNGLDIPSRTKLKNIMHRSTQRKEQALVISTHNIKDIEHLVDSYVFIDNANVVFSIRSKDVFSHFTLLYHQEQVKSHALCTCEVVGGYASLVEKSDGVAVPFDLEIFFTMVWSSPALSERIHILGKKVQGKKW